MRLLATVYRLVATAATCLFLIWASPSAFATAFFSDFGPGGTYGAGGGYSISGSNAWNLTYSAWGAQFTSSSSGTVTQIDLALTNNAGSGNVNVYLYGDSSGSPASSAIGSWTVAAAGQFGSTNNTVVTIPGISGVNLVAGTSYWLLLAPVDAGGSLFDAWNVNSLSPLALGNLVGFSDPTQITSSPSQTVSDQTLPTFDVLGTADAVSAIPLPATLPLFAGGIGALGLVRWRSKRKLA